MAKKLAALAAVLCFLAVPAHAEDKDAKKSKEKQQYVIEYDTNFFGSGAVTSLLALAAMILDEEKTGNILALTPSFFSGSVALNQPNKYINVLGAEWFLFGVRPKDSQTYPSSRTDKLFLGGLGFQLLANLNHGGEMRTSVSFSPVAVRIFKPNFVDVWRGSSPVAYLTAGYSYIFEGSNRREYPAGHAFEIKVIWE